MIKNVRPMIFLDVDGVLNCELFYEECKNNQSEWDVFCFKRIKMLNQLCEEINAEVVISASMRKNHTLEEIRDIFYHNGATFEIISKTPITGYARGTEIKEWLYHNITKEKHDCTYSSFEKYVIIDDDSDMLLNQGKHFFQTDSYSGLTPNTCYRIKRFLTNFFN